MSLSFLDSRLPRIAVATAVALLPLGAAQAAQYHWQPIAEAYGEYDTNRDLDTTDEDGSESLTVLLAPRWWIVTPRARTIIEPQLRFRHYGDQPDARNIEGGIDVSHTYESPRAKFELFGRAQRQDTYNAELADPRFNELDPTNPSSPETGRIGDAGETRDYFNLHPNWSYRVTQRFDLALEGTYEKVDYSLNSPTGRVDYDYVNAGVYPAWRATERATVIAGAYIGRYDASAIRRTADSVGGTLGLRYAWNPTYSLDLSARVERVDSESRGPAPFDVSDTSVGGKLSLARKGIVTDLRLELSHMVTPTGAGGVYETDRVQVQLDRRLSERLTFSSAALYNRDSAVASVDAASDVAYSNVEVGLRWNVTRAWAVNGGYRYLWQDYDATPGTAANHAVFLGVGYRGLDPQQ